MKEIPDIDELLNSFIDGELSPRQQTEIERLISHNAQIAERLAKLEKCKVLVGSLPRAEAPAETAEQIKTSLESKSLHGRRLEYFDHRKGARHLLFRNLVAAAAMIGLVTVLAAVVYTIIGPEYGTERPIAVEGFGRRPVRKVEADRAVPSMVATAEKSVTIGRPTEFIGRLELKTNDLVAVDSFMSKTIESNGLLEKVSPKSQVGKSVYMVSCSRKAVTLLLAKLEGMWEKLDSATLFVETEQADRQVVLAGINAGQIAEIVNQDSLKGRTKLAGDWAFLNNMTKLLPGKDVFAAIGDKRPNLITIPKPVLTSGEETIEKPVSVSEDEEKVSLTIVVIGAGIGN